jgi:hypothetical protein
MSPLLMQTNHNDRQNGFSPACVRKPGFLFLYSNSGQIDRFVLHRNEPEFKFEVKVADSY